MSWELILPPDDFRFYRENISLLEERVVQSFPDGYKAPWILAAIRSVPRHLFVHPGYKSLAYTDNAFPTGSGLTTSAPSVIARMIYHAGVSAGDRLLEIGTGTGYQAAVLAEMGVRVFTIEIDRSMAETAGRILARLGYKLPKERKEEKSKQEAMRYQEIRRLFPHRGRIDLFWGDGRKGLPDRAPFKGIIVAASVPHLEKVFELAGQLSSISGRMVVPVGSRYEQSLHIVERNRDRIATHTLEGVTFNFLRMISNP